MTFDQIEKELDDIERRIGVSKANVTWLHAQIKECEQLLDQNQLPEDKKNEAETKLYELFLKVQFEIKTITNLIDELHKLRDINKSASH